MLTFCQVSILNHLYNNLYIFLMRGGRAGRISGGRRSEVGRAGIGGDKGGV